MSYRYKEPSCRPSLDPRANLAADQRYVLEARVEASMPFIGDLGKVRRAGTVFPSKAQPLNDARNAEEHRRDDSNRGVRR